MQTPICPQCERVIAADDVHVANDLAFCRACNLSTSLSDLMHGTLPDRNVDLTMPPPGAWYRDNGTEKVIGATGRSLSGALGMLLMAAFWNGIVSIFVVIVLASTLTHMGIRPPDWLPMPMVQSGKEMSVGMTIFMWMFLTPFILIGLTMVAAMLSYVFGNVEVKLTDMRGTVFHGYGPFGVRKHFDPAAVRAVRILVVRRPETHRRSRQHPTHARHLLIEMRDGKPIKFGSFLTDARRNFILSALTAVLRGTLDSASTRRGKASR